MFRRLLVSAVLRSHNQIGGRVAVNANQLVGKEPMCRQALYHLQTQHTMHTTGHNNKSHTNSSNSAWLWCAGGIGLVGVLTLIHKKSKWLSNDNWALIPKANAASPPSQGSLRSKYNFVADVVEKVSPAVVFIQSSSYFRKGCGSGFIITNDGFIVTNAHVVQSAKSGQVVVELPNGKKYTGQVQVIDQASDLALVKINDTNLPIIKLATSESLRPGEWVVALGSPLSLSNTVTSGIVSSTGRKSSELGLANSINYIQTDAPITFGNSGGPLVNLDGEAVGVNSMKVTEGISFAIPSDYVKTFLARANEVKRTDKLPKTPQPAYVGIATITLSPHLAAQLRGRIDITELEIDRGLFVVEVNYNSPAHHAGIQKYDIIMKVDGKNTDDHTDLVNAIQDKSVVKMTIYRGGQIKEIYVKPRTQAAP